jgi:hypothetical protein
MGEPSLPMLGGCLCGAVRFAVHEQPVDAGYCHCKRCQGRTGVAASVAVMVPAGSFELLEGADHLGSWEPPDGSKKFFCRTCGAHVFAQKRGTAEPGAIRMSAFDEDPGIRPRWRAWMSSAADWEPIPDDGLPRYLEGLPR